MWATDTECRLVGVDESAEAREMTFEELLNQACESASLPDMARLLLPSTLSDMTKENGIAVTTRETGHVLNEAIEAVNKVIS